MLEPASPRLRHITVSRAVAVLLLLVLVGCGSAQAPVVSQQSAAEPATQTQTPTRNGPSSVGDCPVDSGPVVDARTVAAVDLDGNGSPDPVRLTSSSSPCPDLLFTRLGDDIATTQAQVGSKLTAYGLDLPGQQGQLLVVRSDHPRGGFQLRVYAAGADALVELEVDGRSLIPFVALDVLEHPLSVDCQDGDLVLTEAVAHQPRGGGHTWDVRRTSYAVEGTRVTKGATRAIADKVPPNRLGAKYPELVEHTMFASCRAG